MQIYPLRGGFIHFFVGSPRWKLVKGHLTPSLVEAVQRKKEYDTNLKW